MEIKFLKLRINFCYNKTNAIFRPLSLMQYLWSWNWNLDSTAFIGRT